MRLLHGAGLTLAVLAAADAGDPAATDRRLQRAGAGTGLRLRALESAARGAAFLRTRQRPDGTFLAPGEGTWFAGPDTVPVDALCALALEAEGSPASRAAAARTLERLAPAAGRIPAAVRGHVHAASLVARLAVERRADPAVVAALGEALSSSQDAGSGLWFPRVLRPDVGFGTLVTVAAGKPLPEIETAHAAALGLAAAESAGGRAPAAVWTRHLAALHRLQGADGGWRRAVGIGVSDLASTAQAMGSLVLGREALLRRGPLPPRLGEEIADSLARGRRFLREETADALWIQRSFPGGSPGRTCLLHDAEKALAFTGTADLDGLPPYESVAAVLLESQGRDGRWSGGGPPADDLAEAAFAVLALTRASESLLADPGPPTPPRAEPLWPEEGAPPPSTTVPLREAEEALPWLEGLVRDPRAPEDSLRRTLLFVGRAWVRPADGQDDAWARRAEDAFLRALDGPEGVLAARLLRHGNVRVAAPLRRALAGDLPAEVLREGFGALARLGDPESLRWLCEENLASDDSGPRFDRSREALRAIPRFAGMPGALRRSCSERILNRYEGLETAANPYAPPARKFDPSARARWVACRRFVLDALLALGRDPAGGPGPEAAGRARLTTLREYRQWLQDHADPRKAPWADR